MDPLRIYWEGLSSFSLFAIHYSMNKKFYKPLTMQFKEENRREDAIIFPLWSEEGFVVAIKIICSLYVAGAGHRDKVDVVQ